MTAARLLLSLILLCTHAKLSPAEAFAPSLRTERSLSNNNNIQIEEVKQRRPRSGRRRRVDTSLRTNNSSSDNESSDNNSAAALAKYKKFLLPATAIVSLSLVSLAAYTQHLPGPPIDATAPPSFFGTIPFGVIFSGSYDPYTPSLIYQDLGSTILCIVGAGAFVKSITYSAKIGKLESRDARKIIHTVSAPLFVLLWPLFSNAYGARVFASIVPLLNAVRLLVAGTGGSSSNSDENESELADAISRSGDAKEALGGPFIYVLVLLFSTFFLWTDNYIGIVSMATMAVGDGLADLIGRRFGSSNKWPFNTSKSMAGSAAFVAGSFVGSYGLISWLENFHAMDPIDISTFGLVGRLLIIAVISAAVELIPVGDDNWSVPLSAAVLSAILLN